jgi:hypothetical protein
MTGERGKMNNGMRKQIYDRFKFSHSHIDNQSKHSDE